MTTAIQPQRTRCAECGHEIALATADGCDGCNIYLCANCAESHDCDGYRSMTPEDWRAYREEARRAREEG